MKIVHTLSGSYLPFVPGMDISTILQQVLHCSHSIETRSKVEGGGVPPLDVTAIHSVRCAQALKNSYSQLLLDSKSLLFVRGTVLYLDGDQVSVLCRFEQLGLHV